VRFLRKLASAGQAILCTIHQPSALLFENFDRLLLLERGGETVYFGDIGPDSQVLRDYLARNGANCPDDANPAEFMLEAIGAGSARRIGPHDWKDIWLASPEYQKVLVDIQKLEEKGQNRVEENTTKPQACMSSVLFEGIYYLTTGFRCHPALVSTQSREPKSNLSSLAKPRLRLDEDVCSYLDRPFCIFDFPPIGEQRS